MNKQLKRFLNIGIILNCFLLVSCNRDFPDLLQDKQYGNDTSGVSGKERKVLYLIVDGAMGTAVQQIAPPAISALTETAVYTWNGISGFQDEDTTIAGAWASMMTGVMSDKHKVVSDDFAGNQLPQYPSIITRLKQINAGVKTAVFASSRSFNQYLSADATIDSTFADNDSRVASSVINELQKDKDIKLLVGQFHSVATAGKSYGYSASTTQYSTALLAVDSYIGSIVTALKNRANYNNENWLIIVSSDANEGAIATSVTDQTKFGDPVRNSFIIIHNNAFNNTYYGKPNTTIGASPYRGTAVHLFGYGSTGVKETVTDTKGLYDVPRGKSLTIEAKVKFNRKADGSVSYSYPPFLSKTAARSGNTPGWSFFRVGNDISFYVSTSSSHVGPVGAVIEDDQWHTIAGTIFWNSGNTFMARLYLDGAKVGEEESPLQLSTDNIVSTSNALNIGYQPEVFTSDYIDMYATDVRVWSAALPDATIARYSCMNEIPSDHPYINNLVGDWTLREGSGSVLYDLSPSGQNGTIQGNYSWDSFNEYSNAVCPQADDNYYKTVPNNVDIPFQIFQWLSINILQDWGLNGKYWTTSYNNIK